MKWIKKLRPPAGIVQKLKPTETTIRELILVAGFFMLGYGIWCIYEPAAFIVCGGILLWLGLPPRPRKGGD